ncbi:tail fiber assembly protein [Pantoea sp. GABEPS69]|uniref:tail fiber assembly protein n=1 Tax=Pantoea TaxID=53335 RepID=UPI003892276A
MQRFRQQKNLIADASQAIFFIRNAVYLGMATNEETSQLTPWKNYRLLLSRIDTKNAREIDWSTPQFDQTLKILW